MGNSYVDSCWKILAVRYKGRESTEGEEEEEEREIESTEVDMFSSVDRNEDDSGSDMKVLPSSRRVFTGDPQLMR